MTVSKAMVKLLIHGAAFLCAGWRRCASGMLLALVGALSTQLAGFYLTSDELLEAAKAASWLFVVWSVESAVFCESAKSCVQHCNTVATLHVLHSSQRPPAATQRNVCLEDTLRVAADGAKLRANTQKNADSDLCCERAKNCELVESAGSWS